MNSAFRRLTLTLPAIIGMIVYYFIPMQIPHLTSIEIILLILSISSVFITISKLYKIISHPITDVIELTRNYAPMWYEDKKNEHSEKLQNFLRILKDHFWTEYQK